MTAAHPLRIVIAALFPFACGYMLSYLLRAVNAVVAPDLVAEFSLTPAGLGLLTALYLIAFAIFQLPLGLLFDRYGPRRVQAAMLLVAGLGCLLFAAAPTFLSLMVARALIGLGFAGSLMSGIKASTLWVAPARRPLANTMIMAMGALGLLAATEPTALLKDVIGWRYTFVVFAAFTAACAVYTFLAVPERHEDAPLTTGLRSQLRGLAGIFRLPIFWRLAPLLALAAGTLSAIQTLWAGPWFRDVMGASPEQGARYLLWMAIAFLIGILSAGFVTDRLVRRGVSILTVVAVFYSICLVAQLVLVLRWLEFALPAWLVIAALGQVAIIAYPWLAQRVGNELAGRSNAAINFSMFATAFVAQYAIGLIIGLFPTTGAGYDPDAYSWAFGVFLVLQAAALAWFFAAPAGLMRDSLHEQPASR